MYLLLIIRLNQDIRINKFSSSYVFALSWKTILCSAIKGDSPFNAGQPYALAELTLITPNKLCFVLVRPTFRELLPWAGLWTVNLKTNEPEHLGYTGLNDYAPLGYIEMVKGQCWSKGRAALIRFDPDSEKASYIIGSSLSRHRTDRRYRSVPESSFSWLKCENDLFVPETSLEKMSFGSYNRGCLDLATSTIHEDQLWARLGQSQIAILSRGKSWEEAEIIDNNILDGGPAHRFISTPYGLVTIGEGTIGIIETDNMK